MDNKRRVGVGISLKGGRKIIPTGYRIFDKREL